MPLKKSGNASLQCSKQHKTLQFVFNFLESYISSSTLTPGVLSWPFCNKLLYLNMTVTRNWLTYQQKRIRKVGRFVSQPGKLESLFQSSASWNAKPTFVGFFPYKPKNNHDFKAGKKVLGLIQLMPAAGSH